MSNRGLKAIGFLFFVEQVAVLGGCSNRRSTDSPVLAPSSTEVVKAALNASPRTRDFIFEASNSIVLHSAPLTVNGGDVGARGMGSGPFLSGGVAIDISSGAVVQSTHNVIADSIKLNTGINVGDLQVNGLVNPNAGAHGSVTPLVPLPALPAPAAVTPGTTNLTVGGGKTVTASPGQSLTVSLGTGAVLRLNAGIYQMKDLTIGTNGRVEALGTVQIRIANRLNAGSGFFVGPASGTALTAKDVRVEVSGINGTNGALGSTPKATALGSNGSIRALVLVPNGTLSFATGIYATGAFLARDIDVGSSNAAYAFEDGFPNAGTCTPGGCDDANLCTTDACAADGTCTHTNVAAGTSCSDGNACNGAETCNGAGLCTPGAAVTCVASDACHVPGTCNPATGACSNPAAPTGTSCSDGNACNGAETCNGSGACHAGTPVTCAASDSCHVTGTCNPSTGACSNPPAPAGTSCGDSNACNGAETCDGSGACRSGTPVTCVASDQCHAPGVCDPTTGACSNPAKPDGTACDDSSACTQTDTCQTGTCTGSSSVTCIALDQCHAVGTCDGATGACSNPLQPVGTPCGPAEACAADGQCVATNAAPVVDAGPDQSIDFQQPKPSPNFTLQRISTLFNTPVGIEYHPILKRMVMSVNCCSGQPFNFESVKPDGTHEPYTTFNGLGDEVYFAIARDEVGGFNIGGFPAGQMFTGNGQAGHITRISPDGSTIENPWIILPGEPGLMRGQLQFDRTGVYNGDLIVSTTAGHIWRVTPAGDATMVADLHLGGDFEGLTTVPNDPLRYGPWAGKILTGDENRDGIYAVDATGEVTLYPLLMRPENIHVVPPGENFFGVDYFGGTLYGASASQFKDMVGDIIVTEEFTGDVWHIRWTGTDFQQTLLARVVLWEHTAFGPAAMAEIVSSEVEVALSGTATDDGRPPGSTLSTTWSVVSGPAPVRFADSHAPSTTGTFIDVGTYVLALTATDGTLTTVDTMTVTIRRISPNNDPPVVDAGPDQTVRIPDFVTLAGSASDDGVPIGSPITLTWTQVSGPSAASILNPHAGFTPVLVVAPGTYIFQLEASDGELTRSDTVTVTVNPQPPLTGSTLLVTLANPGPAPIGTFEIATATLLDASVTPISNFPIKLTVTGANPMTAARSSDATGSASFPYQGSYAGVDDIFATATGLSESLDSATVSVAWLDIPAGAPLLTQGWIKSPVHQSTITDGVPIVLSDQITLTNGTLAYWPYSHPDQVHFLATGLSAGPGSTLATFDTTMLSNGSYVIDLTGTDADGRQRQSEVLVTVDGEYKPGRVVVELKDFEVPLVGLPITIGRRYDSLEKDNVGDFGHGWSLMIGHPKLEVDLASNVTITMPNGRRTTFAFAPKYPVVGFIILGFLALPEYQPAPGTYGTLTADGCPVLNLVPDPPTCFGALSLSDLYYAPTQYTYTDPHGTVYVMGATGELRSITDRQGNSLTFQPNGIFSSTGKNVTFTRDAQGRITTVDYPPYFQGQDNAARYQYDAAGDLTTVDLAKVPFVFFRTMHHTYETGTHRLKTSIDARGNTVRTSTYDTAGRLATDTDALGNVTSYTYNLDTRTNTTTFPDTGVVTQTFDARGLVVSETDQLGHTTTHEYDANWNRTKRTNAAGEVATATYDDRGNRTSKTDLTGTTRATFDVTDRPLTITDRLGHVSTIEYDNRGVQSRVADEIGTRFKVTNSDQGLPLTVEDAAGHRLFLEYDAAGNLTKRTDYLGRVTTATYDEAGHRLTETTARGGTTTNQYNLSGTLGFTRDATGYDHTLLYDPNGNQVGEYDNVRPLFNYAYNALDQLTQIQDPFVGTTVTYTRDFRGNPLTMTDRNGHTTTYEYDLSGLLTRTTFADGTFTARTYDVLKRLASTTDERGNTTTYEYEAGCGCSDRVTIVTDPLGHATTTAYDANGRRSSVTDGSGHTTSFVYDVRGNVIDTQYPDGTATHAVYDALDRRTSMTDQTGAVTLYGYDNEGQLTSVTDALGKETTYTYDLDGNLASVTDANDHTTAYAYDLLKRKTKRTLPLGQFETFAYDLAGRQTAHTDFRGKTTLMTYDSRDRLLTKVPDASLGEPSHTYAYSPTEMRTETTDGSGTTSYTYDVRDRLLTKTAAAGTLTYTYDATGNVATMRSSNTNGTSVDYTWDAANQLISVTDRRAGGTTTAAYTPTKRPFTITQPNGVGSEFIYDSLDRVTSMAWRQGSSLASPAFASWSYTHNGRGQRLTSTDITGRAATYTYDSAARLASETISGDPRGASFNGALSYVLDNAGNRLSRTSTLAAIPSATHVYDANDELNADTYDANGNTTASGGHTYVYDFENRLVSKDGGAVALLYNCDGDRVAKSAGGVTTQYLVDELNPTGYLQVLEEVVGGAVQTRYTYGSRIVSQTRDVSATPSTTYYGYDAHGNITFLTDAAGSVTDSYDYDAWGLLIARTGSTPNSRLYAGEELDSELGLLNLRARQYRADTGRFLTIDPVEGVQNQPITFDRYLYGNGDPVINFDPNGTSVATEYGLLISIVGNYLLSNWVAKHAPNPVIGECIRTFASPLGSAASPGGPLVSFIVNAFITVLCLF